MVSSNGKVMPSIPKHPRHTWLMEPWTHTDLTQKVHKNAEKQREHHGAHLVGRLYITRMSLLRLVSAHKHQKVQTRMTLRPNPDTVKKHFVRFKFCSLACAIVGNSSCLEMPKSIW